jgi:Lar family restriction alleviation protein
MTEPNETASGPAASLLHTCDTPNYTDGPCQACAEEKAAFMAKKVNNLLPCPFCGSTNLTLDNLGEGDDWFVSCNNCEIQQIANYTKETAVQRWNTRA